MTKMPYESPETEMILAEFETAFLINSREAGRADAGYVDYEEMEGL